MNQSDIKTEMCFSQSFCNEKTDWLEKNEKSWNRLNNKLKRLELENYNYLDKLERFQYSKWPTTILGAIVVAFWIWFIIKFVRV